MCSSDLAPAFSSANKAAAEFFMDAAAALFAEENAGAVGLMGEVMASCPPRSFAGEERHAAQLRFAFPALLGNPPPLFIRDVDNELPAAVSATVAIPVLENRQVTDGPRHDRRRSKSASQFLPARSASQVNDAALGPAWFFYQVMEPGPYLVRRGGPNSGGKSWPPNQPPTTPAINAVTIEKTKT